MKLPIKTRILEWSIEKNAPFKAEEMEKTLVKEYANERTTSIKEIEKQLDMFARVGVMRAVNLELDDTQSLSVTYQITEAGKKSVGYIPGHGNKIF